VTHFGSVALVGFLASCLGEATIEPADSSGSIPPIWVQPGVDAGTGRDAGTDAGRDSGGSCVPTSFAGAMTIQTRSGSAPAIGTSCGLTVGPRIANGSCHVSVLCNGREWYATQATYGYLPSCTLTASGFSVGTDPETTSAGGDPALTLSMTSLSLRDDASGANGLFQFGGTPTFHAVGPGC
jgi:hypothetical protein